MTGTSAPREVSQDPAHERSTVVSLIGDSVAHSCRSASRAWFCERDLTPGLGGLWDHSWRDLPGRRTRAGCR
jgi:hypothetical protein